jgi:hypothetical protein
MKTSPKCSYSVIENERFGLVFAKTGSIISGTGVDYKGLYSNTSDTKACIWNLTTSLCTFLVIEDMDANPAVTLHLLTAKKYHNTLKSQHVRETRGKNSWKVKNSLEISSPVLEID